jgi:outer membrane protein OmpA-like peptidoglycan-associated protein
LALTELKTGTVVAQASAVARNEGLDSSPTAYYRDSPVLVKDKFIDGYVRTSATAPGQPGDPDYLGAVGVATLINAAGTLYDAENYKESLQRYSEAAESPAGQQLRVLIGLYLTNSKLGNTPAAEQAFAKVVALGISNNILDVKLLFNPGSTEFWSDTKVSGVYPMWLRQIARGAVADKVCMQIVGHTSHTGSEQLNDALSLQRAAYIRQRLELESPTLSGRLDTIGKGYHENIVGSGTDDARDALDRRVEFKIVPCK